MTDRVAIVASASTAVVASSVTPTSGFLHFIDGTVAVILTSSIAVTEGFFFKKKIRRRIDQFRSFLI